MKKILDSNIKNKLEHYILDLKKRRLYLSISQLELAKIANLSQSIIAKLESQKIDPNLSTILKIESALETLEKKNNLTAKQIMIKNVLSVNTQTKIYNIIKIMNENDFSQILVYDMKNKLIGCVYEKTIINIIINKIDIYNTSIKEYIEDLPIMVNKNYPVSDLYYIFENKKTEVILVYEKQKILGLITKVDLFKK